jgi:hypothetical protein
VSTYGMRKRSSSRSSSGTSSRSPLREARVQHAQLEGFARKLEIAVAAGIVDRGTLDAAGKLLHSHIRLEERQLFPLIEELVPDDELRRLGLASRDVTCAVRHPLWLQGAQPGTANGPRRIGQR